MMFFLNLGRAATDDETQVQHVAVLPDPVVTDVGTVVVENAQLTQRIDGEPGGLMIQFAALQFDDPARQSLVLPL